MAHPLSYVDQMIAAMQAVGIQPLENLGERLAATQGEIVRFRAEGDKPHRRNGWAVLFRNGNPAGAFGHYRLGINARWSEAGNRGGVESRASFDRAKLRQQQRPTRRVRQDDAAARAAQEWDEAGPAQSSHPYLQSKGVPPFSVRQSDQILIVPMWNENFSLRNVQRITCQGCKRFLVGGQTEGLFWHHGILLASGRTTDEPLVIAEGYGTAAAIYVATHLAVAAALSAKNLPTVASIMRKHFPHREIVIAADFDGHLKKNVGLLVAREAATAINAAIAYPVEDVASSEISLGLSVDFADIPCGDRARFINLAVGTRSCRRD